MIVSESVSWSETQITSQRNGYNSGITHERELQVASLQNSATIRNPSTHPSKQMLRQETDKCLDDDSTVMFINNKD